MRETRAYNRLKSAHPDAHWQRIENIAGSGVPDANGCKNRIEIWVEFKQFRKPVKKDTLIKLDTKKKSVRDQIAWGVARRRAGGRHYMALMIGNNLHVLNGGLTALIACGMTYGEICQNSLTIDTLFM